MRPRIRTIKPEIWQDERIGDLTHSARLLFVGLITMADDEGRLRELPTAILGHVFPYEEVSPAKLSRWLAEIQVTEMVIRYAAGGKKYIAFRHWTRHQKIDKPNESELPAPPEFVDVSSNGSTFSGRSITDSFEDQSCPPRTRASGPVLDPGPGPLLEVSRAILDFWRECCNHEHAKPTRERMSKIRARLQEGYTEEQIRQGIEGAARSAFVNDAGRVFDDIELICRNGSKLESFIARSEASLRGRVVPIGHKESASDMLRAINPELGEAS